jgi:hypothetical protein
MKLYTMLVVILLAVIATFAADSNVPPMSDGKHVISESKFGGDWVSPQTIITEAIPEEKDKKELIAEAKKMIAAGYTADVR